MASMYDHLLGAGAPGGETSLRDFLAALCAGARESHDLGEGRIDLSFAAGGDAAPMPIDTCALVGIVVNELVANAVEHAFGPEGGGRIVVELRRDEDGGRAVVVEDDGIGVPPGAENASVGLKLARRLAGQMGSSLTLRSAPGRTVWTIPLPGSAGV
jgi:two-component sensor histidine kinase